MPTQKLLLVATLAAAFCPAETAAAERASTQPAALPAAEPTTAPAAMAAEGAGWPKKLAVGSDGFLQLGLLLQGWVVADFADELTSTLRLRRAEIGLKGEIVPGVVSYGVLIDPVKVLESKDTVLLVSNQDPAPTNAEKPESVTAKQPVSAISVLQDVLLTVNTPYVDVTAGQFKIPVSWEGYRSSAKLLFAERALVAKEFGDKRDLGLRLSKTFKYIGYAAGIFNGAGVNNLDGNNDKDVALRLEGYPIDGLVVAGVAYGTLGERKADVKDRYEADLRYERGPFLVQGEYILAHDLGKTGPATDRQGFYTAVAWTFWDILQPALRVGFFDPDLSTNVDPVVASGKDEVWHVDAGLNYYLRKNEAKLQLMYSRFQYETRAANNEFVLAGQVSF